MLIYESKVDYGYGQQDADVPAEWHRALSGLWIFRGIENQDHEAMAKVQSKFKGREINHKLRYMASCIINPADVIGAINKAGNVRWPSVIEFYNELRAMMPPDDKRGTSARVVGLGQYGNIIGAELEMDGDDEREIYAERISELLDCEINLPEIKPHIGLVHAEMSKQTSMVSVIESLPDYVIMAGLHVRVRRDTHQAA